MIKQMAKVFVFLTLAGLFPNNYFSKDHKKYNPRTHVLSKIFNNKIYGWKEKNEISLKSSNQKDLAIINNPENDDLASTQSESHFIVTNEGVIIVGYNNSAINNASPSFIGLAGLSRSFDGGKTFTDESLKFIKAWPNGVTAVGDPCLLYNRETGCVYYLMLVTNDYNQNQKYDVGCVFSTDQGETWKGFVNISHEVKGDADKEWAVLDQTTGVIHVSFTNFSDFGLDGIYYCHSTDGGLSFSKPTLLSNPETDTQWSQVAALDNKVYVFWVEHPNYFDPGLPRYIIYTRSEDGGINFSEPKKIFETIPTGFLAYFEELKKEGWFLNGGYLGTPAYGFRVWDNLSAVVDNSSISPNYGTIYLTWSQGEKADADLGTKRDEANIYISFLKPETTTWSKPQLVAPNRENDQWYPAIDITKNGLIGIAWNDRSSDPLNFKIAKWLGTFELKTDLLLRKSAIPISEEFVPSWGFDPIIATTYFGDYDALQWFNGNWYITATATWRKNSRGYPDQDLYFIAIESNSLTIPK